MTVTSGGSGVGIGFGRSSHRLRYLRTAEEAMAHSTSLLGSPDIDRTCCMDAR